VEDLGWEPVPPEGTIGIHPRADKRSGHYISVGFSFEMMSAIDETREVAIDHTSIIQIFASLVVRTCPTGV